MYTEILALIARAIAKNHGFTFPENVDILRIESARAYLYTSDAEVALEVIERYLAENSIGLNALEVKDGYIMPALAPAEQAKDKTNINWSEIDVLVDEVPKTVPTPKPTTTPAPTPTPAPASTETASTETASKLPADFFLFCSKTEEKLYTTSFVGREKAFKEFLVVKKELEAINIKVGKMTASQSTIKSWYVTGGENGKDKAALFWDTNGWTFGPRTVNGELTGVFEGFELFDHLCDNNAEANNLYAAYWYDATDEEAEAEAVEAQRKEALRKEQNAKTLSDYYKRH